MPDNDQTDWQACPPGTLRSLSSVRTATTRSGWKPFATGVGTGLVLAALIALVAITTGRAPLRPSELYCHEVQPRLQQYQAGSLTEEMNLRVQQHLEKCATCRTIFDRLLEAAATQTASFRLPWSRCRCHNRSNGVTAPRVDSA